MSLPGTTPEQWLRNLKAHYEAKYRAAGNDPAALVRASFDRVRAAVRRAERAGNSKAMVDLHMQLAALAEQMEQAEVRRLRGQPMRHRA